MNGVITGRIKTYGALGVQVINRVIKQVAAIGSFFNVNNTVQVYLHTAGRP